MVFILFFFILACNEKKIDEALEKKISTASQFAVIDLDRCSSCFSEYADLLNLKNKDSALLVVLLSESKKKALIFGKENNLEVFWDSTRYFDRYLEKSSYFIQSNPLAK